MILLDKQSPCLHLDSSASSWYFLLLPHRRGVGEWMDGHLGVARGRPHMFASLLNSSCAVSCLHFSIYLQGLFSFGSCILFIHTDNVHLFVMRSSLWDSVAVLSIFLNKIIVSCSFLVLASHLMTDLIQS